NLVESMLKKINAKSLLILNRSFAVETEALVKSEILSLLKDNPGELHSAEVIELLRSLQTIPGDEFHRIMDDIDLTEELDALNRLGDMYRQTASSDFTKGFEVPDSFHNPVEETLKSALAPAGLTNPEESLFKKASDREAYQFRDTTKSALKVLTEIFQETLKKL
ncbi:MAG: hypothetical protein KDC80_28120, partial [Saprospiraceae bacterium]|nr:hypothetical protein [Saprospiraceae bacterium]